MKTQLLFLADRQLTELTPDQIESLPVYRGRLMLGGLTLTILDYLTWQNLLTSTIQFEASDEALDRLKKETATNAEIWSQMRLVGGVKPRGGESTLDRLNITLKTMPRWSHDGVQFIPDDDGPYEDAVLTIADESITIRFAR